MGTRPIAQNDSLIEPVFCFWPVVCISSFGSSDLTSLQLVQFPET